MTVHKTSITADCPHGAHDVYEASFETERLIPVEVIEAAISCFTKSPIYQEELAAILAECLCCRVTLRGSHGRFVSETEKCSPK